MIINTIYILQGLFIGKCFRVLRPWRLTDRVTHLSNLIVPTICPPTTLSHESFATDAVSEGNLLQFQDGRKNDHVFAVIYNGDIITYVLRATGN